MQDDVKSFYDQYGEAEWDRFDLPIDKIEFSTGKHLIGKYFSGSGNVCDIGGGVGRYCEFLSTLCYDLTLVDLSPELLEIAKKKLGERGVNVADFVCASATDLSMLGDCQFDHALLMGPMYHLTKKDDRMKALSELRRITAHESISIVTYFGSYGMLRLGIADMAKRFQDPSEIERFLGPTTFDESELSGFTECHFSTPPSIRFELEEAGFTVVSYASAQGFVGGIRGDLERLFEECRPAYSNVLDVAVRYSEDVRFRDFGQHLHYVIKKA